MKALVTGGAGFIGSHLTDELLNRGVRVRVLDDFSSGTLRNLQKVSKKIEIMRGDIRDFNTVRSAMRGVGIVYHLAGIVSMEKFLKDPREASEINIMGTLTVFQAAHKANVRRVVYASSCAVYGADHTVPKRELMRMEPISWYAETKRMNERHAALFNQYFGVETVGLRFFNVFGPRQDPRSPYSGVIAIFFKDFSEGEQPVIYGDGTQTRDFVYVKDVARACVLASRKAGLGGQVFNVATGRGTTLNHLVKCFRSVFGTKIQSIHKKARPWDVHDSIADIRKIRKALSFKPEYTLVQALRQMKAHAV